MGGRKELGGNVQAQLPFDHCADHNGIIPPALALNGVVGNGGGLVVFNTADTVGHLLVKNGKSVDKSLDMSKILTGFGGSSFEFMPSSKRSEKAKKLIKTIYKGNNFKYW